MARLAMKTMGYHINVVVNKLKGLTLCEMTTILSEIIDKYFIFKMFISELFILQTKYLCNFSDSR